MNRLIIIIFIATSLSSCSNNKNESRQNNSSKNSENELYFEFYGNYIPTKEIMMNEYLFNSIEISTNDSLKGNKIDLIYLRFTNTNNDEYHVIVNTKWEGSKEDFIISANDSLIGNIEIHGKFFGTKGPMNDNIEDPKTIVFSGNILIDNKINEKLDCTYFEGD